MSKDEEKDLKREKIDRLYRQLGELQMELEKIARIAQAIQQKKIQILAEIENENTKHKEPANKS